MIQYKSSMQKRIFLLIVVALLASGCRSRLLNVQIFPTSTPKATPTATLVPTPTPTPTLPPTPTPSPAVRIENADQDLLLGDYEQARRQYQEALNGSSDPKIQAAASYGMGRALYLQHNYSTAINTLKAMIQQYPQSDQVADAYFFMGQALDAQKIYDQAAEAYGKFLELRPGVIDWYVQELRGDDFMAAGNPEAAATAYDASIKAPQEGTTIWVELKLGKAYAAQGDFASAITTYLDVYSKSDNDYAKAQANLLMGQAYLTLGKTEQAHARFIDSVANYPKSYDTYSGLVQLVNDGVVVNELSRGLVDYYAGQYGLAIDAFTRYISATENVDATPYYYRALSHLAKDEYGLAIEDWNTIIANFQTDTLWPNAFEEKAYVQWAYLDQFDDAVNTLLQYIQLAPDSAQAPGFLFDAARIQERNNELTQAADTWASMIEKYPSAEQSYQGLFLAGVTYYRAQDYTKAITALQRALVLGNTPEDQAAAYLWLGKCQLAKGDKTAAQNDWTQGAQADPTGYYGVRSNELLQGRAPFTLGGPIDLGYNLDQERPEAETWMRTTFNLPEGTDLSGLGALAGDARIQRGDLFWELGLYSQARDEYESVRTSVMKDPVGTYRLMNYLLDRGVYRSAILAARQVLTLANMDDAATLKAPLYFNHIRFGVFFKDQVLDASQSENILPIFLLSTLRQESFFEWFAVSGAGARGLMQIMPATGQEIASNMSLPDYSEDDLFRPKINIAMGSHYLARQRDYFGGSLYAALAAYNGGPGNTSYWINLSGNDPDLFLEVIRADETRQYIQQIYEFFNIYRLLYQRGL